MPPLPHRHHSLPTGPTDGSVFVRDCRDCTLCVAARQLRTRDCTRLDIGACTPGWAEGVHVR